MLVAITSEAIVCRCQRTSIQHSMPSQLLQWYADLKLVNGDGSCVGSSTELVADRRCCGRCQPGSSCLHSATMLKVLHHGCVKMKWTRSRTGKTPQVDGGGEACQRAKVGCHTSPDVHMISHIYCRCRELPALPMSRHTTSVYNLIIKVNIPAAIP